MSAGKSSAAADDPWIVGRARTVVKLRAAVYALGIALGVASAATRSNAVFGATAFVLLLPAASSLVARASRARRLALTVEGRIVLLFALGLLAAALNTGTNLLYALFALLAAQLVVSALASSAVLRALFVRRRAPSRVRARERFAVEVSVRNGKALPAFALVVAEARPGDLVTETKPAAFLPRVGGRDSARATYETAFARRGELALEGLAVETRFPFGLVARRVELAAPHTILVTPEVHPVRAQTLEARAHADAPARRPMASLETQAAVRSLRDYRPGDHPRAIHWRASARRGALVVKELERSEPRKAIVVLDAWTGSRELPPAERDALVEDAVTLAASLMTALAARGESPGLATLAPAPIVHWPGKSDGAASQALATLARLAPPSGPDLGELARNARRAASGARVFVVTLRPEARAREALAALDAPQARYLELARPQELGRWLEVAAPETAAAPPAAAPSEVRP